MISVCVCKIKDNFYETDEKLLTVVIIIVIPRPGNFAF